MSNTYKDLIFTSTPDSIQDILEFKDIDQLDVSKLKEAQDLMMQAKFEEAYDIINMISDYSKKMITAERMNIIKDTCLALQRFYKTDIKPYINTKQAEWQNILNLFKYIGIWQSNIQYEKNNIVGKLVDGNLILYLCVERPTLGTSIDNATYYRQVSFVGRQGESGTGLTYRGSWSASENYYKEDWVIDENIWYICNTNNANMKPSSNPIVWQPFLSSTIPSIQMQSTTPSRLTDGEIWFYEVG